MDEVYTGVLEQYAQIERDAKTGEDNARTRLAQEAYDCATKFDPRDPISILIAVRLCALAKTA